MLKVAQSKSLMTKLTNRRPSPLGKLRKPLGELLARAVNLLYPARCLGCDASGNFICAKCVAELLPPDEGACPTCQTAVKPGGICVMCEYGEFVYDSINAAFQMNGVARELVHALKYHDLRALAPRMGDIMAEYVGSCDLEVDGLTPLPIHPARKRRRGYNQSDLLGKVIADKLEIPFKPEWLKRVKNTPPQVTLKGFDERIYSMQNAFQCDVELDGARVLLIDDVVTSGSTINVAAEELKKAGAGEVHIAAFTRGGW